MPPSVTFVTLVTLVTLFSCQPPIDPAAEAETLKQVDRDFSTLSEKEGMKKAFLEYVADDGVLLRPNRLPVVGKDAVGKLLEPVADEAFTLIWEPLYGSVAASGDLGYTYGTYELTVDTLLEKGTYVSIWRRDAAGQWKYVLDSGNEGVGE